VNEGDVVGIRADHLQLSAQAFYWQGEPLEILYEDEELIAVEKRRNMHSIRLRGEDDPTVADFLISYRPEQKKVSPDSREAGLLQRLDFETSGVIVAAKTCEAWKGFREKLFGEEFEKEYLAIVEGNFPEHQRIIDIPLYQNGDGSKMLELENISDIPTHKRVFEVQTVCKKEPTPKLNIPGAFSLVRCSATRACRHQIRAHLAAIGFPLIDDSLYGGSSFSGLSWGEGFYLRAVSVRIDEKDIRVQDELFGLNQKG
jgi:23S rRNA pseudouridine1911/1915/1917 synthase